MVAAVERMVVGVDAGGTKTRAICLSVDGRVRGSGVAGPANHVTGPLGQARRSIGEAIACATAFAGLGRPLPVAAVCIGSAGLEHAGEEREGRSLLDDHLVQAGRVVLDSDAYVAWAGAFQCRPGVVVIAGTGSMSLGVDAAGRRVKVGGWGWRVGDEGSAYAIAVEAIRAALRTLDGRCDAVLLWEELERFAQQALVDSAGVPLDGDPLAVRAWLYGTERVPAEIAAFAPAVERAALAGCSVARDVLERAGHELAAAALAVRAQLPDSVPLPVALVGSVLEHNAVVGEALAGALQGAPGITAAQAAVYPPCVGAALLALEASGTAPDRAVFRALDGTLPSRPSESRAAPSAASR